MKHPNSYLPKYNVQSETDEGETTPLNAKINSPSNDPDVFEDDEINEPDHDDEDEEEEEEEDGDDFDDDQDIPSYGFPQVRNRREPSDIDLIISNAGTQFTSIKTKKPLFCV